MERLRTWIRSERAQVVWALGGLWALFFAPVLLSDGIPFDRDLVQLYIPLRHYLAERLRQGALPQWFPYDALGTPFIGQIVTATFHPLTWLFLPLSAQLAVKLNLLLLYLLGLAGAYRLARAVQTTRLAAVTGALAFAFGGYGVGISNNLPYVLGWATLPWVFRAALRLVERQRLKDAAVLGLLLASVFLGGDAQGAVEGLPLIVGALIIAGFSRRRVVLIALAGLVAALTTGAELLPALAIARDAARRTEVGSDWYGLTWALHPRRLPGLVIPTYTPLTWDTRFGRELFNDLPFLWSSTVFAGGVSLWLAAVGALERRRRSLVLAGLILLYVWLALGQRGGLLPVAWKLVPVLQGFRYPEKYLAGAWVALGPLVAIGVDQLRTLRRSHVGLGLAGALACFASAGLVVSNDVVGWWWANAGHPLAADDPAHRVLQAAWTRGLLTTGVLLLVAVGLTKWLPSRRAAWAALAGLVFLELWAGNGGQLKLAPPDSFTAPNPFAAVVRAAAPRAGPPDHVFHYRTIAINPDAVEGSQDLFVRDWRLKLIPATDAFEHISGFGFGLAGYSQRSYDALSMDHERHHALGPLFNGCFAVTSLDTALEPGEVEVARVEDAGLKLQRHPCAERAYLAPTTPVADEAAALQALPGLWASRRVVWEGGPALAGHGAVRWRQAEPEALQWEVEAEQPAGLIVNDTFAPGWTATVDGVSTPIYPANVAMRGVAVPAGHHVVAMVYRTPGLRLGLGLTLAGLLLALGLFVGSGRTA